MLDMNQKAEPSREVVTESIVEDALGVLQSMLAVATPDLCKPDVTMGQVEAMLAIVALTPSGREIVERDWRLRRDLLREWLSRMEEQDLSVLAQGIAALKSASADSTLDETMVAAAG
jgi:hypothetical protein